MLTCLISIRFLFLAQLYMAGDCSKGALPFISLPALGTVLPGSNTLFVFDDNGNTVENYFFYLGMSPYTWDLYAGSVPVAVGSVAVSGIPTDGSLIYGAFQFKIDSVWQTTFYSWLAATGPISVDETLDVPGDYASINAALASLTSRSISPDATVTIQVADGVFAGYEPITINHPDGNQIHLLGNTAIPENCVLQFNDQGVLVENGKHLGLIDGFTLQGNDLTGSGIWASMNGVIRCGENLIVRDFFTGVYAHMGGIIYAQSVISTSNANGGFIARSGIIDARLATASENAISGVAAVYGGIIYFDQGTAEGNSVHGIQAYSQGTISATGCFSLNNGQWGLLAQTMSMIYATSPNLSNNGYGAAFSAEGGMIFQ